MHAENRITEKVLARLLLYSGFDVAFRQPSEYTKYQKEVEDTVNQQIFNHVGSKTDGQLEFPKPDAKKTSAKTKALMGDVKLTNEKARLFLNKVDCLLPICLIGRDEITVAKWKKDTADEFIELWIGLNGTQGMANYLHDLAAGHFSYYLRKYRTLYRYSQQERPSDAEIQAVVDDWSMDDWRVTYTDYDDEDEFEEEGV
eukprot:scaffold94039_cov54-Attheya_sp.AAC.2